MVKWLLDTAAAKLKTLVKESRLKNRTQKQPTMLEASSESIISRNNNDASIKNTKLETLNFEITFPYLKQIIKPTRQNLSMRLSTILFTSNVREKLLKKS